jgi:hypothetical protein
LFRCTQERSGEADSYAENYDSVEQVIAIGWIEMVEGSSEK